MKKARVAIIGTGNIGSDLLVKVGRSTVLACSLFTGKNRESEGIKRAAAMGIPTSFESIDAIVKNPGCCDIVFDATNAAAHYHNGPVLKRLKKFTIDMTPSRYGMMCVPLLNLDACLQKLNVNMISCGGQATIPIIWAIKQVHPEIEYVEVVSSIASKSAGIGTRDNIDEYTEATSDAIVALTGVPKAKAIVILNPADPPIYMHNTIYAPIDRPKINELETLIRAMTKSIQRYVPGFTVTLGPVYENNRITVMTEVIGLGDYLPVYAGNLDIINCAAIAVAEEYAKRKLH